MNNKTNSCFTFDAKWEVEIKTLVVIRMNIMCVCVCVCVGGGGGEPGLVDRVLALHAGSRGFDSHRGHMSEQFFRSNRPGYPHPVSSELENSGIRVAVGDCSVTERRRWRPLYQTGKTVHVHAKHYKHNEDGCTARGCVRQWFRTAEPLGERRYENWNTHTHVCGGRGVWVVVGDRERFYH